MVAKRGLFAFIFENLASPNFDIANLPVFGSKSIYLYSPGPGVFLFVFFSSIKSIVWGLIVKLWCILVFTWFSYYINYVVHFLARASYAAVESNKIYQVFYHG